MNIDMVWIGYLIYWPLVYTTRNYTLQITDTDQCPQSITVSTRRFLAKASTEGDSSPPRTQDLLSQPPVQNSCQLTTHLTGFQDGGHFTLLVFTLQEDIQLTWQRNSFTNQPATSRHFTQLNCWQLLTTLLVSSIYSLGPDPIENAASSNPSVVVIGGCLAIDWISFPRERVYRPLLRNGCLFIKLLHSNGCTRPFRGLCPATGLYATVFLILLRHS
jgi:hypothetical protein